MQIKPFSWTNDPTVLLWREWPTGDFLHPMYSAREQITLGWHQYTHTRTAGKLSIKPFCAAFCCNNSCILRHLPKGGAVLLLTVVTRLSWAAFTNRKQGVSKLKMYIAKHREIGPVCINKMVINASGNHLPQQTMIESEGVGPWVLETTKETLCTQRFLCAEYQWRTAMHNQRLKASFHSLTFLPTGAQTAEPARWER